MDVQNFHLILPIEIRWLSNEKMLPPVNEIQKESAAYLETENYEQYCKYIKNDLGMSKFKYLTEIFAQLNGLNSDIQGRYENIHKSKNKLVAFISYKI